MDVVCAKNLKVPKPSAEWMQKLQACVAGFAGPSDPLTASLYDERWTGRQAVHCLYSAGLRTIVDLQEADTSRLRPCTWRVLAGGHSSVTNAMGCWASYEGEGVPAKVMAVLHGPEMADMLNSTELLNDMKELADGGGHPYELRVFRVPALYLEAFWLKSLSAARGDLILPYGLILDGRDRVKLGAGGRLERNRPYPMAEFLNHVREAARRRLAADDYAPMAPRTRA